MARKQSEAIDQPKTNFIIHEGRKCRLQPHAEGYRYRCRAAGREADLYYAVPLKQAKEALRKDLEKGETKRRADSAATLEQVVKAYEAMPKRSGKKASSVNIGRLRGIVRLVLGKELDKVALSAAGPKLWEAYQAARQGGKLDLSTRGPEHYAINSAVKGALKLFARKLRPKYLDAGITIPENVRDVEMLKEMTLPRAPVKDAELKQEWAKLKDTDKAKWRAVGLARFAGMRQQEIQAIHREWIVMHEGVVFALLQDRPEKLFLHKTGSMYRAPIINSELAADLLTAGEGPLVVPETTCPSMWFGREPQAWVKRFTKARKPLHRLRGLYADDVKKMNEQAELAHQKGLQAAAAALGHGRNTATTEKHYTTP